ncbi:MAG TPA: hypothetical protein VMG12_39440 [Polyangiaceae bacterium]|nr:hypothetical protein [Polyangiaceae bacterium]
MTPPWFDTTGQRARAGTLALLAACGDVTIEEQAAPSPADAIGANDAIGAGGSGSGSAGPMPAPPIAATPPFDYGYGDYGALPEAIGGAPEAALGGSGPQAPGPDGEGSGGSGAAEPSTPLVRCSGGAREACGVFVTASGTEIPLGPYGSSVDVNVGAGFENAIALGDADGGFSCALFSAGFGEDPEGTDALLDTEGLRFDLYSVFRPVNVTPGETYPILTWGNGTCAQPAGYAALLHYLASYGFFVVAANGRWVGSGAALTHGIDFLVAANADPDSPYFGLIDTTRVGVMGHSQGGSGARAASSDARVQSAILFNGGTAADTPFFALSGDYDVGGGTDPRSFMSSVARAPQAAGLWFRQVPQTGSSSGHLTLMVQPERVIEPARRWFDYTLRDDAEARAWFVGDDCRLCNGADEFEFSARGLR